MNEQEYLAYCRAQPNVYELERSLVAAWDMLHSAYTQAERDKWQAEIRILRQVVDEKWDKIRRGIL